MILQLTHQSYWQDCCRKDGPRCQCFICQHEREVLLVPVCAMSHKSWYSLGLWWAGRHGAAMCPGSRDSQKPPGLWKQGYTQKIKARGYLTLFSADLDPASSFGPSSGRRHWWTAVSSVELQESNQGLGHLSCEKMGQLGMSSLEKKMTSRELEVPTTHLGQWQLETGILQCVWWEEKEVLDINYNMKCWDWI